MRSGARWTTYPLIAWVAMTTGGRTYESECTSKLLALQDSPLADRLRARMNEQCVLYIMP
jgi:hypothetical protein